MICYLIYHSFDAEKNAAYIELYRRHCAARSLGFSLLLCEELPPWEDCAPLLRGGFVINRTRDAALSQLCEAAGIPVFNGSALVRLGNDKKAALDYVASLGLPILRSEDRPEALLADCGSCVMKSLDGHGGSEVFWLKEPAEATAHQIDCPGRRWLYQEPTDTPGRDLRVYLVGQEIVGAMLRESDADFRANYSLGAAARPYTLNEHERALVSKIAAALPVGHCGIDFLFHKGSWIFNEIEDVVGSRMLYRYTDTDVAARYLDYILSIL